MSILKQIAFILSALVLASIAGYLAFAWTEPTQAPPNGNVPAPINVGSVAQTKEGVLQINADFTANRLLDSSNNSYYVDPANAGYAGLFAGKVGIGTTSPSAKLDVDGGGVIIRGSSLPTLQGLNLGKTSDSGYSYIYSTNNSGNLVELSLSGMPITLMNGDVGIGTLEPQVKLDVAGAIKIGSQDTCNANAAGAIRYNAAEEKFEGCNGTNWKSIAFWSCGQNITFIYKGEQVTYGTVESQGKCWMDRNLGASRVATASDDSAAYGDYFQWGRLDDGHQTRTSGTISTCSSGDNPGHSNFITRSASPYDWRCSQNNNLWQGVSGTNNPCPSGWRIPTRTEWETEKGSWSEPGFSGAFASPLKLPRGGYRSYIDGSVSQETAYGNYWSSTTYLTSYSYYLKVYGVGSSVEHDGKRAYGYQVRCILDQS